jgi:hypothetical protein
MNNIRSLFMCLMAICAGYNTSAQCTGNCPAGAVTLPAATTTLATGSTYCISTATNLSAYSYTVDGTLVIRGGTVTLGNVTLNKTGVIRVMFGAKLIITGILTGNNTAPVSAIDNITICNGGLLDITGSFSQGYTNIALNDFGVMKVTGAWTAGATASSVKMGNGALIELCSSFNLNKSGFFTETSTGVSYLVVHAPMIQSVYPNGYLSNLQNASRINWTADAGAAFVVHPPAYTCNTCGNYNLAPPGTSSVCGSAANAQNSIVLTIPGNQPTREPINSNVNQAIVFPNPAKKYVLLQLPKGHSYTNMAIYNQAGQLVQSSAVKAGTSPTRYELPVQLPRGLYFIRLTGSATSLTLRLAKD